MQVQLFHFSRTKVRGPMGVFDEERMRPVPVPSITHGGVTYERDASGWIDVPLPVYNELKRVHHARPDGGFTRFATPGEVDEQTRLGMVDDTEPAPVPKARPRRPAPSDLRGVLSSE